MSDQKIQPLSRAWQDLQNRTQGFIAQKEGEIALGKIAGRTVLDDEGAIIVDAGHLIDEEVLARAETAGRLRAVAAAALTGQVQDYRDRARERFEGTPEGQEARSFATMELFAEARNFVGRIAGLDVTDIRGSVVIPAGKKIEIEDVRAAREEDLLAALIYSAQQPAPIAETAAPQTEVSQPETLPAQPGPDVQPLRRTVAMPDSRHRQGPENRMPLTGNRSTGS